MNKEHLWIYDCEVTKFDNLFVFKNKVTKEYRVFHNDNLAIVKFLVSEPDIMLAGFNNKHYDSFILKAITMGASPMLVKEINDRIIGGEQGWNIEMMRDGIPNVDEQGNLVNYIRPLEIPQYDLMDDCQVGQSLKSIEGHYGLDITESSVSFDIDHPWTDEELEEMIYYCKHDVDATDILDDLRQNYLNGKIAVGERAGISERDALAMTNAKLTAKFLDAKPKKRNDERNYQYPDNLLREWIPDEVFQFFDRLKDKSISDEECFKGKYEMKIDDCEVTIGFGGIHGAIPNYIEEGE